MCAITPLPMSLRVINVCGAKMYCSPLVGMLLDCRLKMQPFNVTCYLLIGLTRILKSCVPSLNGWGLLTTGEGKLRHASQSIIVGNSGFLPNCMKKVWFIAKAVGSIGIR